MSDAASKLRARIPLSPGVIAANPQLFGPQSPAATTEATATKEQKLKEVRKMNGTEGRYGDILDAKKRRGEIIDYVFEGVRLKWGTDPKTGQAMYYKPDFFVTLPGATDGTYLYLCVEVKGKKVWDRDLVRFKGARAQWSQFSFEMWQWSNREWTRIL